MTASYRKASTVDLQQFRTNVTNLATAQKQPDDEEFHKIIQGWMNEVTVAKAKAVVDEVASQVKGGVHKLLDYVHHHHNKS